MSKLPNKDTRLKRLLEAGYFLEELPPPFVSSEFAKFRSHFQKVLDPKVQHSAYARYSVPRHNSARRTLGIPNPINYFFLAKELSDNWVEIRKFLRQSSISEFKPIFDTSGPRALFGINFEHVEAEISKLQALHNKCVKVDISRFYPTVYTHSLGWALYTKKFVKANLHKIYKGSLGDRLDRLVRYCQENQSIGLPIGPDTSRILSEIICVAIEKCIADKIVQFSDRAVRYVDDIAIGLSIEDNPEQFVSHIASAFSEFGLEINIDKTRVIGKGERFHPEWISILRGYRITGVTKRKNEIVEDYFKNALHLSSDHERDNVLTYAVKRSRSFKIDDDEWDYYENYLYRCARYNTNSIAAVSQILIERNYKMAMKGKSINLSMAKALVLDMIKQYSPLGFDYEVSWALFLCKALKISLNSKEVAPVLGMTSPTCALIAIDLQNLGLLPKGLNLKFWRSFANADGLRSEMWLFAYEIARKGWLPTIPKDYVKDDDNFGKLLEKSVYFYDETKNVKSTASEQKKAASQLWKIKLVTSKWNEYF
ncbi:RNA-directed DNA polymerase [Mesorhizobium humile]|uniref:RNA-directed DNA polymerase n=1 Tax=Mesorhizobium humile TaxID=3072313 RepID=A0ABU4YLN3_9HYPH|nr:MULTISPECIES: RNA-directed DNA polymerase [unclassified Mesorhizobium]MDX8457791.1 RNA-directed DNA polymerase [Mesorhizobium sp. VK2D]MDX8487871.1 RNA-directed DNA polymerase [Mesorhizobium sp. VK2B]